MAKFVRMTVIALLAMFAASTVVHAASATGMSLEMAMADDSGMDMADCVGCDDDGSGPDGLACDILCVAPMVGLLDSSAASDDIAPSSVLKPVAAYTFSGRTGPPDPFPPRVLL
jgi:hypothetical protein